MNGLIPDPADPEPLRPREGYRRLAAGDQVDGFIVDGALAAETRLACFSDLYRATAPDGTPAALKISHSVQHAQRLAVTAAAHAAVSHPRVPRLLGAGDGWMATALVEGVTGVIPAHPAPDDVLLCALDVLDALGAMHRAGFVHADAQPTEHWIVDGDGYTTLLHLRGYVRHGPGLNRSPEQWRVEAYDRRADIYTVGAVTADLYIAADLYRGQHDIHRASMPAPLAHVLARASEAEVDHRYQSAEEFRTALTAAIGESGLTPDRQRLGRAVRATPPARRVAGMSGRSGSAPRGRALLENYRTARKEAA